MNLQAARSMILNDRLDWNKPHLRWISNRFYRHFRSAQLR